MSRASSDHASRMRKRALRRLARQEYDAYRVHYNSLRASGYENHQARGRAWTLLRHQFLDAYLELYALEQVSPGYDTSPLIRGRAWQRAMGLLGNLRKVPYREHYERFLADGLNMPAAAYQASTVIRAQEPELFARLLAAEIRLWQFASDEATSEPAVPAEAASARARFHAAVDALKRTADDTPGNLYTALTEHITDLTASIQRTAAPRIE